MGQVNEYVYIKNATPVSKNPKCGSLIVTLIIFMCRGRKIDETLQKYVFRWKALILRVSLS